MAEKGYVSPRGLRSTQTRLARSAYAIVLFTVALGGSLYREIFGLPGFLVALGVVLVWGGVLFIVDPPSRFRWYRLPAPVILFLVATLVAIFFADSLSVAAADFGLQLAATVLAVMVAYLLTWQETLRTLATALRYMLTVYAALFIWQSFEVAEPVSASLGLVSIIALVVFGVQAWAGLVRPSLGLIWILFSLAGLFLAGSSIPFAALVVVLVSLFFALWARRSAVDRRMPMYWVGVLALGATVTAFFLLRGTILPIIGINAEAAFNENVFITVLQKQGVVGLILFCFLVFVTAWRVWFRAVDQPRRGAGAPLAYATSALWPFLTTMSLLVFSLVQGTLTGESGWFLLVLFAIKTRFDYIVPSKQDDTKKRAWRDVPLTQPQITHSNQVANRAADKLTT